MGTTKKAAYKVHNGTDFDVIHFETEASQVKTAAGSDVESFVNSNVNQNIYRQAIINGNFDIAQRGTDFNPAPNSYTLDRWKASHAYDNNCRIMQSAQYPNNKSQYSVYLSQVVATGVANAYTDLIQYIEDYLKFAGQIVTLSGYYKCDAGVQGSAYIRDQINNSGVPTFNATVWTPFSISFNVAPNPTTLEVHLRILRGGLAVGSGIRFAQIQVNIGPTAVPFMPKSFHDELLACMRYYEKSYPYATVPGTASVWYGYTIFNTKSTIPNNGLFAYAPFKVKKRINGTATVYDCSNGNENRIGNILPYSDATFQMSCDENGLRVLNGSGGSATVSDTMLTFHWTVDAEM